MLGIWKIILKYQTLRGFVFYTPLKTQVLNKDRTPLTIMAQAINSLNLPLIMFNQGQR